MKKYLKDNIYLYLFSIIFVIRQLILLSAYKITAIVPLRTGYLGFVPWANFDGVHYLSIAENGYGIFQQAFFPLFPLLIRGISQFLNFNLVNSSYLVVYLCLFFTLFFLWKLVRADYNKNISFWTVMFFISFPTSFFLNAIYTESLFLSLLLAGFWFARKKNFLAASVFAGFASAARFVGIILLPVLMLEAYEYVKQKKLTAFKEKIQTFIPILLISPLGILSYIYYLWINYKDPFIFIHSQSAFGVERSSGEIIFLPQVIWRYLKILTQVPFSNFNYWIALLELFIFLAVLFIIYLSYRKGIRTSYIIFSLLSILIPTFSGTLSSIPRYALSSFVIFIFFARIENKLLRYVLLTLSVFLQSLLAVLFLKGYFVS